MTPAAMLLSLAERANLLYFSFDLNTQRFTYWNTSFISFIGMDGNELQPNTLLPMIHPEDQQYIISQYRGLLQGRLVHDVECRFVRGNHERWLRMNPFLFAEKGRIYWLAMQKILPYIKA